MGKTAAQIWFGLLGKGIAPTVWGQATLQVAILYNNEMCRQYPELRYCADNWKAQRIATNNYSSWYKTHGPSRDSTGKRKKTTGKSTAAPPVIEARKKIKLDDADLIVINPLWEPNSSEGTDVNGTEAPVHLQALADVAAAVPVAVPASAGATAPVTSDTFPIPSFSSPNTADCPAVRSLSSGGSPGGPDPDGFPSPDSCPASPRSSCSENPPPQVPAAAVAQGSKMVATKSLTPRPPDAVATASPLGEPTHPPISPSSSNRTTKTENESDLDASEPRKAAHRSNGATPSVSPCSNTTPERFIRRQLPVFLFTPATPPSPSDDPLLLVSSSYTNTPGFGLFRETERRSPNRDLLPAPIIESTHIARRISSNPPASAGDHSPRSAPGAPPPSMAMRFPLNPPANTEEEEADPPMMLVPIKEDPPTPRTHARTSAWGIWGSPWPGRGRFGANGIFRMDGRRPSTTLE
ncbi:hypothetical protein B0H13DRAFT_2381208 [Mycena leptocephala]|nr:hypothetical protein B0H13DRAFT_2381208 [Mycena leptocephala]